MTVADAIAATVVSSMAASAAVASVTVFAIVENCTPTMSGAVAVAVAPSNVAADAIVVFSHEHAYARLNP